MQGSYEQVCLWTPSFNQGRIGSLSYFCFTFNTRNDSASFWTTTLPLFQSKRQTPYFFGQLILSLFQASCIFHRQSTKNIKNNISYIWVIEMLISYSKAILAIFFLIESLLNTFWLVNTFICTQIIHRLEIVSQIIFFFCKF